ncbi:GDP-mannose 4,6-dehydratase [Ramlibacter solisilvae]|uniref:GDP-6-deoxy-D-lyxo-4-hexulose reductase n=1 Tax=Ramlibacter tataouinensis TaxID=94132 RepID=A0A127JVD7_9BURK|nr:GDP-mannose 4,6-dehydratase [Ramlibacter tataouinensis]AMO23839.1 GDP-6-deoxy-D-lyxo-4-hexulose reductase [Ramlibacter tataouinensis]
MRIALTGSDGFTGRHFQAVAEREGHEVLPFRADLTDAAATQAEAAAVQADALVHLAAISFVGHHDEHRFYDVNLFGTLNLLDALAKTGRPWRRILLASSANVYGNCEQSPIAESQPPAPVNHYAMSKVASELMARSRFPQLPVVITRPFNYTGPGQHEAFVIPKLVGHFKRRSPTVNLGNLDVQREYNDVRFVCEAYLRLLELGTPGSAYNICTGITHDFNAVIGLLQDLTGHRIEVRTDPALVRANEVHRLCGDPARLQQTIGATTAYQLQDTLAWMLAS